MLNVKKLMRIYGTIKGDVSPNVNLEGNFIHSQHLSSFILFTPLEIVFRAMGKLPSGNMDIRIYNEYKVHIRFRMSGQEQELTSLLKREMEELFPGKFILATSTEECFFQIMVEVIDTNFSAD